MDILALVDKNGQFQQPTIGSEFVTQQPTTPSNIDIDVAITNIYNHGIALNSVQLEWCIEQFYNNFLNYQIGSMDLYCAYNLNDVITNSTVPESEKIRYYNLIEEWLDQVDIILGENEDGESNHYLGTRSRL